MFSPSSVLNPLLPVTAYFPDSRTQSHAHSPRRQWFLRQPDTPFALDNNVTMGSIQPQRNASLSDPWVPTDMVTVTRCPPSAVFVPAALGMGPPFDWRNPWSDASTISQFGNDMADSDGVSIWPTMRDPNRMSMSDDTATTNDMIPEFVSGLDKHETLGGGGPMHLSGPSLEDDPLPSANVDMQVITNSPSTINSAGGSFFVPYPRTASMSNLATGAGETPSSFSGDATANLVLSPNSAGSLSHGMFSQPLSVPLSRHTQTLPLLGSRVKARKANRLGVRHAPSNPGAAWFTQTLDTKDTRKLSQPPLDASPSTIFGACTQDASFDGPMPSASVGPTFSSRLGSDSAIGAGGLAMTGRTSLPLGDACLGALNSGGSGRSSSKKRHRDSTIACLEVDEANERAPLQPNPPIRSAAGAHDESE